MSDNNEYFAAKASTEATAVLMGRIDHWCHNLESNGYLNKLRTAWSAYHGAYYTDVSSGHQITFGGTEGELVNLPVNHIRNLAQHILVMTCATRPSMEARATNTDYKSLTQTILANGLLDYYMREKRLEKVLKRAVEYAIVMGSGYIKMAWNETSGQLYDFNEDTNTPIYEGDVEFTNLSPFDVVMDSTKENQDHDWIITRTFKNRFDIIAKYPELRDKVLSLKTKDDDQNRLNMLGRSETEDVPVYEFFHRRSEALPEGRYIMFLASEVVLSDGPLPYRTLPVFRIAMADILGTPFAYTTVFDLIPLQEALNSLYSTVMSNQNAFGVQSILVPRGADISISELTNGLNIIEANIQNGAEPKPLQLTHTAPETFKFLEIIQSQMEVLSGVNSVARGNPDIAAKSGNALALIQSMAIQFMSGLQQSYVEMIEDVGTGLINMLRDFAAVPRVAAIVGRSNRAEMKEFKGDDLNNVNRVIVDMGNPLARTTAGRVQMAEQMLQMGAIKDPNQYFTVINTGKLDVMTEGVQSELILIKGENERMMQGVAAPVLDIDDHKQHITEHKAVLADPDLRGNPQLVKIVLDHIQGHITSLQQADPNLLGLLGQQPLPPPQPQGPPPQGGPGGPGPGNGPGGPPPGPQGGPPPGPSDSPQGQGLPSPKDAGMEAPQGGSLPGMPKLPKPPKPFNNMPTNPADVPAH